jgi:glutamyl-Q tRNA(Asp) synthetase
MRERFAPSPTGLLHLGHAYYALMAWDAARENDAEFLLRIEDIDTPRCKPEFEQAIYDDLEWLGIRWQEPVLRQSNRKPVYDETIQKLWNDNILYACTCSRKDIAIASAPQEGGEALLGPDGIIYPKTCFGNTSSSGSTPMPQQASLRLDMEQACLEGINFQEIGKGPQGETGQIKVSADELINNIGDIVIARKDIGISYHLAVVLDDAHQGITHVTRGEDLYEATKIHVALQKLLGLPTPIYRHHRLIRDDNGKRLAKRDDARSIQSLRDNGVSPNNFRAMVGLK